MKNNLRYAAMVTLFFFLGSLAACTTCKQRFSIKTADDVQSLKVDPEKKYDIVFMDGQKSRVGGDYLQIRGDTIGVKYEQQDDFRYYQYSQLKEICERGVSGGRTAGLIGGIVGFLALWVGVGFIVGVKAE